MLMLEYGKLNSKGGSGMKFEVILADLVVTVVQIRNVAPEQRY